jgi:hypothetical protein
MQNGFKPFSIVEGAYTPQKTTLHSDTCLHGIPNTCILHYLIRQYVGVECAIQILRSVAELASAGVLEKLIFPVQHKSYGHSHLFIQRPPVFCIVYISRARVDYAIAGGALHTSLMK